MVRSSRADQQVGRSLGIISICSILAAATLVVGGCAATRGVSEPRRQAKSPPTSSDEILYDEEFWAGPPSVLRPVSVDAGTAGGARGQAATVKAAGSGGKAGALYATQPVPTRDAKDFGPAGAQGGESAPGGAVSNGEIHAEAAAPLRRDAAGGTEVHGAPSTPSEVPPGGLAQAVVDRAAASVVEVKPAPRRPAPTPGDQPGSARLITNFEGSLQVPAGRSILARLAVPAERVAIANPDVAEVVIISPREILINGRGQKVKLTSGDEVVREAQTSVIVWDRDGRSDMRTLYINPSRMEQILLEVTVAEINRSALERYGVDFNAYEQGNFIFSSPSKAATIGDKFSDVIPGADGIIGDFPISTNRLSLLYKNFNEDFTVFIEALQQEALAKILARPVVLARSGEEAHLRVGGEVPVVYATANVATVTFKEFGVLLTFRPEFTDDGRIDLRVAMEVSEPTSALATSFGGFEVPSFIGRQAETRVLLERDQSLMIGGLYRDSTAENEEKIPYLGDIPFLGSFFRKTVFEVTRTELVMAVRPQVAEDVRDLTVKELPTDRPPLSRDEVRTNKPSPYGVTRPRIQRPLPPPPPDRRSMDEYIQR